MTFSSDYIAAVMAAAAQNNKPAVEPERCPFCSYANSMMTCKCVDACDNIDCWQGPRGPWQSMPGTVRTQVPFPVFET